MTSKITIGGMFIQNEDHLGKTSIGTNILFGRGVAGKKNQGFGQHSSDQTTVFAPIHAVIDEDEFDFPSIKNIW
ncbi:hypothetical protein ACF5W4_09935 [Bacillota bacterium Lsc_1132]